MATLVGTQNDFAHALYELCELDYDAVEAYEAAINRLESIDYKMTLMQFKADHQRHIKDIAALLTLHNFKVPSGPSLKTILTQGKVVLANILGDKAILKAMLSNEIDMNTAYERLVSHEMRWADANEVLIRGLEDERRHKFWFENHTD